MVPVMGRVTINGTQSQFSCKKTIPLDHGVGSSDQSPVINSFFAKQVARLLKPFVAVALQPVQKVARLHEVARAFWVF